MRVRIGVTGISVLAVLLSGIGIGRAQAPPPSPPPLPSAPGFVSTYEIVHTLRAAGFDPLAPPLREGSIYVARATDYRGILMRVVLDARTGAIRDANRIVPGPGNYAGPYGAVYGERAYGSDGRGLYGSGPYDPDPYDTEDAGPSGPGPYRGVVPLPYGLPRNADAPPAPVVPHPAAGTSVMPLPRPRPPQLASRKAADDAKSGAATATDIKPSTAVDPKPDTKSDIKPDPQPTATTAKPVAPAAATPAAPPPPAPAKPSKAPSTLTINN